MRDGFDESPMRLGRRFGFWKGVQMVGAMVLIGAALTAFVVFLWAVIG